MGFNVSLKSNDSVFLTLDGPRDVKSSFMQAVENALKRRVIKFEVDIAQNLGALEEIFLQLVALQKVLGKRGERLVLVCHTNIPPELETRLHDSGMELKIEQEVKSLSETHSLTGVTFAEFYKQAKLKNWPRLETRFKEVYDELKDLIQSERALQKEIEFYKKRMISIRPVVAEKLDLVKINQQNFDQEQKLRDLHAQNQAMQIEIVKLQQDLQTRKAKYKELSEQLEISGKCLQ